MAGTNTLPIQAIARQVGTTMQEFVRERIEPIYRGYELLPKMRANGRISGGHGGEFLEMRPRKRRRTITTGAGNALEISYPNTNVHDIVTLPYVEYKLGESYTQFEDLASKPQAVRFFKKSMNLAAECVDDFMADLPPKLYIDGVANAGDFHGFESWAGHTGSCISDSVLADPSDTYATKSTALGVSGSWSGDYPAGEGDTEYNWWSPFLVDYNNTLLGGDEANWAHQWQQALNYAATYMYRLQKKKPNTCVMDAELLLEAQNSLIGAQQIRVDRTASDRDPATPRLFYNGIELIQEYGCTASAAYLFDIKDVTLKHMGSDLIQVKEDFSIDEGVYKMLFRCFGNLDFKTPAFHCKLLAVSQAGS
jgi:hypothetical protein